MPNSVLLSLRIQNTVDIASKLVRTFRRNTEIWAVFFDVERDLVKVYAGSCRRRLRLTNFGCHDRSYGRGQSYQQRYHNPP